MAISAANQWAGKVEAVQTGAVTTEVPVRLDAGPVITATVTNASAERLALAAGAAVQVLVKASSIMLVTGAVPAMSARNVLTGRITALEQGPVHSLVTLAGDAELSVTSTITTASARRLELAPGVEVSAVFKAGQVMLARAG